MAAVTPLGQTSDQIAKEFVASHPTAKLGSLSMSGQRRVATEATGKELHRLVTEFARVIQPSGLGDVAAGVLHAIGITKARVSKITGTDCNCDKRQEAMNDAWKGFKAAIGLETADPQQSETALPQ